MGEGSNEGQMAAVDMFKQPSVVQTKLGNAFTTGAQPFDPIGEQLKKPANSVFHTVCE